MKILMVLQAERKDWYTYLREDDQNDYYLLFHENKKDIPESIYRDKFFKKVYAWNEFSTPQKLLQNIKPDRIVFFEVIDQRQIALLVTANKNCLKTFYLEHGASAVRESSLKNYEPKPNFLNERLKYIKNRFFSSFLNLIRSKSFYYSAAFKVKSVHSFVKYCSLPFKMLVTTPNKALLNTKFAERAPATSIVFNKSNFEVFELYTGIKEESAVYTGIPLFDKLYNSETHIGSHVVFVDHPYLEQGQNSWTPNFHKKIADALVEFSVSLNVKIYVRLHPNSSMELWKSYGYESPNFIMSQNVDFTSELLSSKLIISYSSTLLTGMLCAKKNIVLLGWHPTPAISSFDFSQFGICHVSFDIKDLQNKYDFWVDNNLAERNEDKYGHYIENMNNPFDGKAGSRVLQTITL